MFLNSAHVLFIVINIYHKGHGQKGLRRGYAPAKNAGCLRVKRQPFPLRKISSPSFSNWPFVVFILYCLPFLQPLYSYLPSANFWAPCESPKTLFTAGRLTRHSKICGNGVGIQSQPAKYTNCKLRQGRYSKAYLKENSYLTVTCDSYKYPANPPRMIGNPHKSDAKR